MGIISTGCSLCRKRRIKCDEAKPGCQRCFRIGSICPGYDRGLKVVLYTDNSDRRKKAAKRDQPGDATAATGHDLIKTRDFGTNQRQSVATGGCSNVPKIRIQDREASGSSSSDVAVQQEPKFGIQPSLLRDIEARSVSLFIASFVQDPTSVAEQPAFLDFLPDLHAASADGSCLPQTLKAVSLLNFINRYQAWDTLSEYARHSYCNALRAVNTALSDPKLATTDQALTSVWLLSMYELLAPGNLSVGQRTPWVNHVNGTMHLLRLRGKQGLSASIGRSLFRLVHTPIIVMDMMLGNKPSEEIADLNQHMLDLDVEDSYAVFSVSSYIQQVAGIRSRLKEWVETHTKTPPQDSDILDLRRTILEAFNTNASNAFETWALQRPGWNPQEVDDEHNALLETPALGMHYFSSVSIMVNWVVMWTTKMLLLQSLIGCLSHLPGTPNASVSNDDTEGGLAAIDVHGLKAQLQTIANSILGCASFAFGDVTRDGRKSPFSTIQSSAYSNSAIGAYHMFWPVGAVLASPYTTPEQKLTAQTALRSIGERFCIVQALTYANI